MKKRILIFTLLFFGLGFTLHFSTAFAGLSDGLVAYYPFDSNTNDASGNGNDGVEHGGIKYKKGITGDSVSFDGVDDYINVPSSSKLNPSDQLTISFWVKVGSFTNQWSPLFHKGGPMLSGYSNREYSIWLHDTSSLHVASAGDGSVQHAYNVCCAQLNYWTHYVIIVDRRNHRDKIYVDGVLKTTISDTYSTFNNNNEELLIGWTEETNSSFSLFNGQLDELRIYDRAITEQEVVTLYNQPLSTTVPLTVVTESTFNAGLEGWTGYSPELSWRSSGGNPTGYLRWRDYGAPSKILSAPNKFKGDWSTLDGIGVLSFDQAILSTGNFNGRGSRAVSIIGPGGKATWHGPRAPSNCSNYPVCGWNTFTIPIIESAWEVKSGSWSELLDNVTSLKINPEFYANVCCGSEITALDNVFLAGPDPSVKSDSIGESIIIGANYEFFVSNNEQKTFLIQAINITDLSQSATLEVINTNPDMSVSIPVVNPIHLSAEEVQDISIIVNAENSPPGICDSILLKLTTENGETVYSNLKISVIEQGSQYLPDLSINSRDIQLVDYTLGDSAKLQAEIHNIGLTPAENVTLQFYEFGNLLGETTLSNIPAESSETGSITVPIGTSGGEHLIQVVVDSSDDIMELDEQNNAASQIVKWGGIVPTPGNILVTGNLPSTVYTGELFNVSGQAVYDVYVNGVRYTDYVVKGGAVNIKITDDTGKQWTYGTIHTDINGNIHKYLLAPSTVGTYHLFASVTDQTFIGNQEMVFQVVERPATPQLPPSPPNGVVSGGMTGNWNYDSPSGSWVWTPTTNDPPPKSDLFVFSENIHFANTNPAPQKETTIFTEIRYWAPNTDMVAENIPVNFYATYPGTVTEKIGSALIPSLSVGYPDFGSRYVSTTWKNNQGEGIYLIEAEIDPSYQEHNMLNNAATRALIVGNLQTYSGAIEGQVSDPKGGVGEVVIELLDVSGTTFIVSRLTDIDGYYLFENLPVGDYQVHITTPDGYQVDAERKQTQVVDQQISEVDFNLTILDKLCGDLDHDQDVDGNDMIILRNALRTSMDQPEFVEEADYDNDGDIDFSDYQIWYGCYKDFISQ